MFKIGEFSKLTQVSVRMLRYYDEMGLLTPAEIDTWNGYRMYSAEQISILNKIVYLRDSGFNVAEIAVIINNKNVDFLTEKLNQKYSEIQKNIELEQDKLRKIEIAEKELLNGKSEIHYNISIKSIPSYYVLSLRKVIPNYYYESELWKEISSFAKQERIDVSNRTFSIYYDEEYKENDVDVELCVPVKKKYENIDEFLFYDTKAVPFMACTMVYGEFSNIAGAYLALAKWLEKNNQYKMNGSTRQIVHRGPWNEENSQKYLTELQIPLDKN